MKTWTTKNGTRITRVLAGRSNVFLVQGGNIQVLVDTSPSRKLTMLHRRLKSLRVNQLDYLVLTHTHFDHAGNAARLKEHYKAKLIVHTSEAEYIRSGVNKFPRGTNPLTRLLINQIGDRLTANFDFQACLPDILVESNFSFTEPDFLLRLIHTPGHSTGSVSLIVDNDIAIVGDAMFGIFPWNILPPFADDQDALIRSWKKLFETGCQVFLPAHGRQISRNLLKFCI